MKAFLTAISLVTVGLTAMASDGSTFDRTSQLNNNQGQWTCSTRSKGRRYQASATTQAVAQNTVMNACVKGGGKLPQCQRRLQCSVTDGGFPVPPNPGPTQSSYYDWGRGQDGYGYCYEYDYFGQVMNWGQAQDNWYCERVSPSHYTWGYYSGSSQPYCFQVTPRGDVMNSGYPVANYLCGY